jgi:hypothetical protein
VETAQNPLRPFKALELLDRAFRIYRDNFTTFIGIVALVMVPTTVISLVMNTWFSDRIALSQFGTDSSSMSTSQIYGFFGQMLGMYAGLILVDFLIALLQGVFVSGPLTYITSERHLGRSVTVGDTWSAVRGRLASLGTALFLYYVILGGISVAVSLALCLCGLGFGLIAYIWVALSAFVTPVIILERTGVIAGLQRAWVLGKARVWPILGLSVAILVISFVIGLALGFAIQLVIRPAIGSASYTAANAVQIVLQTIVSVFIAPIWPITLTLLYYDARVRVEGLDIALQVVNKPDPRPADVVSPPPPSDWLISSKDMVNLGIFVMGGFVLLLVLGGLYFLLVFAIMGVGRF